MQPPPQPFPQATTTPITYFDLMQHVGTKGKYQKISLIIWSIMWLTTGSILLSAPFLTFTPKFSCTSIQNLKLNQEQCEQYVCQLPQDQFERFLAPAQFVSISTKYPTLNCSKKWVIDLLSSLVYAGCFFGYISISLLVDNIGRKKSIFLSYAIATCGMAIVVFQQSYIMIGVGLFLMGYGCDSAINICFYFIMESVEEISRQKQSIIIQFLFSFGGVANILYFILCKDFHIVIAVFMLIPSIICLLAVFFFISDTPYYLIKLTQPQVACCQLQKIFQTNTGSRMSQQKRYALMETIKSLKVKMQNEISENKVQKRVTPLDLFKKSQIRYISISICLITVTIYLLYYGPLILIGKLSFNLYINALVVTGSQVITYPITYMFIQMLPRSKTGVYMYAISGFVSIGLFFVVGSLCQSNESCAGLKFLQLGLIFIFRFCSSLEFSVFLIQCNQLFPTQIRGMGTGISSALGTIASTSAPFIFGSRIQSNSGMSHIMLVFVGISFMGCLLFWYLPETLGKVVKDNIGQEINQKQYPERPHKGHIQLVQVNQGD